MFTQWFDREHLRALRRRDMAHTADPERLDGRYLELIDQQLVSLCDEYKEAVSRFVGCDEDDCPIASVVISQPGGSSSALAGEPVHFTADDLKVLLKGTEPSDNPSTAPETVIYTRYSDDATHPTACAYRPTNEPSANLMAYLWKRANASGGSHGLAE